MENRTKKIIFVFAALLGVFMVFEAKAIVFVPPVIYIATLSVGSFIANAFIFLAFFMAARGMIDRTYFGRSPHEIVRLFLRFIGIFIVFGIAALFSLALLDPLSDKEILIAGFLSGIMSWFLFMLGGYREYRLSELKKKKLFLRSAVFLSIIVSFTTFISAHFAIETEIFNYGEKYDLQKKEPVGALPDAFLPAPQKSFEKPESAGLREKKDFANGADSEKEKNMLTTDFRKALLFYPQNNDLCRVYFNSIEILSQSSSRDCYYYNNIGEIERIFCPIELRYEAIPVGVEINKGAASIRGGGSCSENYSAIVSQEGFNMAK